MTDNQEINPIYVVFGAPGYADSIDRELHMRPHTHSVCERQWISVSSGFTQGSLYTRYAAHNGADCPYLIPRS